MMALRQSLPFKVFRSKRLKHLHRTIDVASEIWNHAVAVKNRHYRLFGKGLAKAKLQAHLAKLRRGRRSHWQAVASQSVQAITDRLYLAGEAYLKGDVKRPPTFRKRRKDRSFTLKQSGYAVLGHGRIKILGRTYRFNQSRPLTGIIKTVNVRRDALADVHLTFSCEVQPPDPAPKTGQTAGADLGLKHFLTLSTGEKVAAPQPLKAELRHLRKARASPEPQKEGFRVPCRAGKTVARVHKKAANIRNDWPWKQARLLVLRFDLLAFETLNLKAIHQLWGRKAGDIGFADFLLKAQWMAKKLGKDLVKTDRWNPTTQTCHGCGRRQAMALTTRVFQCGGCGISEDRDLNAAKNILEAGRRFWSGASRKPTAVARRVNHRRIPRTLAVGVRQNGV